MKRGSLVTCARGSFLYLIFPSIFSFVITFFFKETKKERKTGHSRFHKGFRFCAQPEPASSPPPLSVCPLLPLEIVFPGLSQTGPPVGETLSTSTQPQRTEVLPLCGAGHPAGRPSSWPLLVVVNDLSTPARSYEHPSRGASPVHAQGPAPRRVGSAG